jgi:hypothetical protein
MAKKKQSIEFPLSDVEFDISFTQLMGHLAEPDPGSTEPAVDSYTRLGLNMDTQYNPLLAFLGDAATENTWLHVYPLEKHKASHTSLLTAQKNSLKKKILAIIRPLRISLKAEDKTSPGFLSEADKKFFYIPIPNVPTSSADTMRTNNPVPALSMYSVRHMEHIIDTHDPGAPKSNSLPEGVQFLWLKRYIGTVPPTSEAQFTHLLFSGKFRNISDFEAADLNQSAWYTGAFISTTGEVGGWSPFISATILQTS